MKSLSFPSETNRGRNGGMAGRLGWAGAGAGVALSVFATLAGSPARAADPALLSFGVAYFDQDWIEPGIFFLKSGNDEQNPAVDFRLEYRFGTSLIPWTEPYAKVKP